MVKSPIRCKVIIQFLLFKAILSSFVVKYTDNLQNAQGCFYRSQLITKHVPRDNKKIRKKTKMLKKHNTL